MHAQHSTAHATQDAKRTNAPRYTPSSLAGYWSQDEVFKAWAGSLDPECNRPYTDDEAAQFIRDFCRVASRKELDGAKGEVLSRFNFMRRTFAAWRDEYLR
jgi:hypothetical protein